MQKTLRGIKGLTLMELIVVLAILSVIGAIVLPNFFGITDRARLRSDIQSTIVIRNAMELYRIENGNVPAGNMNQVFTLLYNGDFLATSLTQDSTQVAGAQWRLDNGTVRLFIPAALYSDISDDLEPHERAVIRVNDRIVEGN